MLASPGTFYAYACCYILQLIYDFKDGGCSLDLVSLLPDELSEQDKMKFSKIGVRTPSMG